MGRDSNRPRRIGELIRRELVEAIERELNDPRVSHIHIRHLSPFPSNLGELLAGFDRILVPEMNMGQLSTLLRDKLGIDPVPLPKVTGQPFLVAELEAAIRAQLSEAPLRYSGSESREARG